MEARECEVQALELLGRIASAAERSASASEELNKLATEDREPVDVAADDLFDAPVCPHCGRPDPDTAISSGAEGKLSEFVLATPCGSCGGPIYAIPVGWRIVGTPEDAKRLLDEAHGLERRDT